MTNKLYDSKGQLIGYIRTVEKNQHEDLPEGDSFHWSRTRIWPV